MNILIIGNGFDLAHKLNTRYTDFLDYVNREKINTEIIKIKKRNLWYDYFNRIEKRNNWVDFESEIAFIIKAISDKIIVMQGKNMLQKDPFKVEPSELEGVKDAKLKDLVFCLNRCMNELENNESDIGTKNNYGGGLNLSNEKLSEILLEELNNLTNDLNIYLLEEVKNLDKNNMYIKNLNSKNIDYVLSFNYTDTYNIIYNKFSNQTKVESDFIHGRINEENHNLVLGINRDVDMSEDEFIKFGKFYQRILKRTGVEHTNIISKMKKTSLNNVYIIGHSMDKTDGDIIRMFILEENTKTTIYYHNEEGRANLIINLIKLLGKDIVEAKMQKTEPSIKLEELEMREGGGTCDKN